MNESSPTRSGSRRLIWKMLGGLLFLMLAVVVSLFLPIWDIPAFAPPEFPAPAARTPAQAWFREALRSNVPAKERYFSFRSITHETAVKEDALRFYVTYEEVLPLIPGLFEVENPEAASADPEDPEASLTEEAQICSKLLLLHVHYAPSVEEQIHWSVLHLTFAKHFAEASRDIHERDTSFFVLRDALENVRFLQTATPGIVHTSSALREALLALPPLRELAIQGLEEGYRQMDPCLEEADFVDLKGGKPNPNIQRYHWIHFLYQPQRTRRIVLETVLHERAVLRGDIPETSENPMQTFLRVFRSKTTIINLCMPGTWRNIVGTATIYDTEPYFQKMRELTLQNQKTLTEILQLP